MILIDPESKMIKSVSERKRVKGEMLIINHLPVRIKKGSMFEILYAVTSKPFVLTEFLFQTIVKILHFLHFFTLKHLFIVGTGRYRYKILFYSFKSMVVQ